MAAEMDSQDSLSPVPGDQQKSPQLNPELLEESGSGKGKAIECEMAAETDRETDRNSQHQDSDSQHQDSHSHHRDSHSQHQDSDSEHQDSPSPVPDGQQKSKRKGESGSRNSKGIANKMASETHPDQYRRHQDSRGRHQDSHSPVPGDQQKSPPLTLVLLGESGSGKSASGNTILGMKVFTSEPSSMPVTTQCETKTKSISGTEVTVIDTPDFFDEDLQEPSTHIQRCRELCEGGLCVYLLVIQIGRFTEGERDILERLEKALQTRIRDRAIILFTRGDDLKSHIDEFVSNTNPFLKTFIGKCGRRYHVFNNTTLVTQQPNEKGSTGWFKSFLGVSNTTSHKREVEKQVKELMDKIAELVNMTNMFSVN